jgi:DNA transformation protein
MFGGHGIFHDGKMFGIIDSKGKAFMKADDSFKKEFMSKGSEQHSRMPYFSIPASIYKANDELVVWARKSIELSK